MASYDGAGAIIQESLEELKHLSAFLKTSDDPSTPVTVLIGGWAVYSYNPWYGSMDIDLITNSRIRHSLNNYLVGKRGFARARNPDDTKRVQKQTKSGRYILIDYGSRDQEDPFEGGKIYVRYELLDGHTEQRLIGGSVPFHVPNRTLLLFFKLKAAWDRNFRISSEISHDIEWERGKLKKDRSDILALLDPDHGGQDINFSSLGGLLEDYGFLKPCLKDISDDADAIAFYGRMEQRKVEDLIEQVMSLIE